MHHEKYDSQRDTTDPPLHGNGEKASNQADNSGGPPVTDSQPKEDDDLQYLTGIRLGLIVTSLTVVLFLMMLDGSILATAIPYITDEFHSVLDIGWYGSAYQLSNAALTPLAGKLYTRLNSKWSFLTFLLIFEFGSLLCGAAQSSAMLIVGRAVAGMGASGLMNGGLTILNSCVPIHRQPVFIGIMSALGFLGLAIGPLIGGALTEYATWRWCFYINLPVGGTMALAVAALHVPDHISKPPWRLVASNVFSEFDLPGFALFAPASTMFFLALQWGGNQYAWGSPTVVGLFCGAAGAFAAWLIWDHHKGDAAMMPLSTLGRRPVWSSCAASVFFFGSIFVSSYFLPIYFQVVLGATPFMSGVDVLASILPQMLVTMVVGLVVQRLGYLLPFMLLSGVVNSVGNGLLSLVSPTTSTGAWVGYQIVVGIGRGLGNSVPMLYIQKSVPKAAVPVAMSCLVFCQNFGGGVMIVLTQVILTNSLRETVPQFAPSVNPELVIAAGSTAIRKLVSGDALAGVLQAYSISLDRIFYLSAGCSVAALFFSFFMGGSHTPSDTQKANDGLVGLAVV